MSVRLCMMCMCRCVVGADRFEWLLLGEVGRASRGWEGGEVLSVAKV